MKLLKCGSFYLVVLLSITCNEAKNTTKLTIATAANMQFAMQAIAVAFTNQTGIDCDLIISSSGKLTAQIKAGAPYDVFVSADLKYPMAIYESGLAAGFPQVYAHGQLVLWTINSELEPSVEQLNSNSIQHIAIANPSTAPYGQAAMSVLQQQEFYESIKEKLVYGESIAQTNQFILSGVASIGFTAYSVVHSPQMKDRGRWMLLDTAAYKPIEQGIVVIEQKATENKAADMFLAFMLSERAQQILMNFGYIVEN